MRWIEWCDGVGEIESQIQSSNLFSPQENLGGVQLAAGTFLVEPCFGEWCWPSSAAAAINLVTSRLRLDHSRLAFTARPDLLPQTSIQCHVQLLCRHTGTSCGPRASLSEVRNVGRQTFSTANHLLIGDAPTLAAAQGQIRSEFRQKASLPLDDPAIPEAVQHAEAVARILRHNVVQGRQQEGQDGMYSESHIGHTGDLYLVSCV